jgi:hypothetical protein
VLSDSAPRMYLRTREERLADVLLPSSATLHALLLCELKQLLVWTTRLVSRSSRALLHHTTN